MSNLRLLNFANLHLYIFLALTLILDLVCDTPALSLFSDAISRKLASGIFYLVQCPKRKRHTEEKKCFGFDGRRGEEKLANWPTGIFFKERGEGRHNRKKFYGKDFKFLVGGGGR